MDNSTTFEVVGLVGNTALDSPDEFLEPFYYRILTASRQVKYLGVKGTKPNGLDIHGKELGFDAVPNGKWTIGILTILPATGKLVLTSTTQTPLCTIDTWHPNSIDLLDIGDPFSRMEDQELLCQGKLHSTIRGPHFGETRTMVHVAWSPTQLHPVDAITDIYSRIQLHGIAPKFLAHVTENRYRVIGYMVQGFQGQPATVHDLAACREVLSKLHELGIVYGSLRPSSFLVTDGQVFLHDFSNSYVTDDSEELGAEMAQLEEGLKRGGGFSKCLTEELSQKLLAIQERDGKLHPLLVLYAQREGKLMEVTAEEHKQMLGTLWVDGDRFLIPPEWREI